MKAFWAVVKKELTSVTRDRTILIAILIQLFIASFSSALLMGMLSLYDADSAGIYMDLNINVAVLGSNNTLLTGYLAERGVRVLPYANLAQAETAFRNGYVQAIVVLPERRAGVEEMRLILPKEEAASSLIMNILQEPLKRYENALRQQQGIAVRYTDLKGKPPTTFEFIYSVLIPILMFFPAFVAGGMVIDSLSEEVENNTLETLLSAPLSLNRVIGAKITAAIILTVIQCIAWLILLRINQIAIHNLALVLLFATIVAGIITVGSAMVTVWFRDRERSQFVYALFLLVAAASSYLLDLSPIKTISRLTTGDFFTGGLHVFIFMDILAVMVVLMVFITRRFAKQGS